MIGPRVTEADLRVLGGEWKANHVRWQLIWGGFAHSPADSASVSRRPSSQPSTSPKTIPSAKPLANRSGKFHGDGTSANAIRATSADPISEAIATARRSTVISEMTLMPMNFDSSQGNTGQGRVWSGTMVYTLRKVDGEWKIAQIDRLPAG